jgi:microcompartment protein CcmK/EutM
VIRRVHESVAIDSVGSSDIEPALVACVNVARDHSEHAFVSPRGSLGLGADDMVFVDAP